MSRELTAQEVIYKFEAEGLNFREEDELLPEYNEVYKKIKTALEIDNVGYNIYLIDDFSKEKLENIMSFVNKAYEDKGKPKDICYVIKGEDKNPKALYLSNGKGIELKKFVERIQICYAEATYEFYNNTSIKEKEDLLENIQKKRNELVTKLAKAAEEDGFEIRPTTTGFSFIPLKDGGAMTEKDYDGLGLEEKDDILIKVGKLKIFAQDILEELKDVEVEETDKIKEYMVSFLDEQSMEVKEDYIKNFNEDIEAKEYLDFLCSEIEKNIIANYSISYEDDEEKINEIIYKYEVNVIQDNSKNNKPQVVFEEDPSINNLIGSIDYENKNGVYVTDLSLIKGGSFLKANEGCLIIRVNSLLTNPSAYYYLKKSLISEKIDFDYNRGYLELLSLSGLKPEPIQIKEKVILIGDFETYDILYNYDEDFKKIFKIRAEYNPILDASDYTKKKLVEGTHRVCKKNNLKPINDGAIKEVAKYLSRKAGSKNKIYFNDYELNKLLMIANNKVMEEKRASIEEKDIIQCAYNEEQIEKEIMENYRDKKILINVTGSSIGQINGLSVIDIGYICFGKPIRITCNCYKGDGNIIDVQKESNMSGNIHSKSINILKGYINRLIGGYSRLPVDFHLSFEQLYGMLDGDSASVAEVICMISALSKIPVKQNIAVTGSINQFGEVQPIGGVNEKIEGFFKTCKLVDKVEGKGVVIPYSNKEDLILSDEVEKEIEGGRFHIYTMATVEDAMEILMGDENISFQEIMNAVDKECKKYKSKK